MPQIDSGGLLRRLVIAALASAHQDARKKMAPKPDRGHNKYAPGSGRLDLFTGACASFVVNTLELQMSRVPLS